MSRNMTIWIEIVFNILYLLVIWGLVVKMILNRRSVKPVDEKPAKYFLWAFALLALGDTGHVGFRVLAYAMGGLEKNGVLVGLGALATAVTVTLFYVMVLEAWRTRFKKNYGLIGVVLLTAAVIRLILMIPAQNQWTSPLPPADWSIYRNIPLMVQGIGAAALILKDALKNRDRVFKWVSIMILVSYACYMPVIFLVRRIPAIGMLMIPKTMAYMAIAFISYYAFYRGDK